MIPAKSTIQRRESGGGAFEGQIFQETNETFRVEIFTKQKNEWASFWAEKYGTKNFESLATGGDGKIMVCNGRDLPLGGFAYEAGHSFATKSFGDTNPAADKSGPNRYTAAARSGEPHPTEYAKAGPQNQGSLAEDFAESVRLYVTDCKDLTENFPKRANALKELFA